MQVKESTIGEASKHIDYDKLAELYNDLKLNTSVVIDQVYNITLFKRRLETWGLVHDVDFVAGNRNGETWITRKSKASMTRG